MRCLFRTATLLRMAGILITLGTAFGSAAAATDEVCKKLIATGNPEYPPFLWRDPDDESHLIGANADLMQSLSKEIGIPVEVKYIGPWGRVQEEAKLGRVDLLAGAFLTLPRFDYMDYFYPAFRETRTVIWVRKDSALTYKKWKDLVGKRGITVINNSFGEDFDRYASESLKVATVPSLEQALTLLTLSRADYLIYEEDPGLAYIAKMNIQNLKPLLPPVTNENLYLTISHKSPCNTPEMRGRIAKALYKLEKQNLMNKLVSSNIQLWRKQQAK
ncbi:MULTISPECIES: ABC transporter substrate-binding protein [unclassified Undibacterium]|uniref:substrate-binding periplasmic protein n=1 Tax=unclassified Undibacterium TaxID=2630295 RepID=UPI00164A77BD|nr:MULTISPECIES: transporter substrate-binding domain-containing protein [unclassified Undibacterium]MBC3929897.1 transporter substrate-binding domain-containing protein [Undibacterium sp. CY21W]MBK1891882.1 transporter substrate-binding domain-containing protein [Undibacterium sp. 14-3-2]MBY0571827.1 transporter substrate-binding domain-containing protein [Burkholderiaceae bacterium]